MTPTQPRTKESGLLRERIELWLPHSPGYMELWRYLDDAIRAERAEAVREYRELVLPAKVEEAVSEYREALNLLRRWMEATEGSDPTLRLLWEETEEFLDRSGVTG